jgi:glycosyltransferase involved in cell wall biosynthesis
VRGFARWCRERAIQILQTCDFYSNVVGMAGAALARVPVRIASRREIAPDKSRAQLALQRAAYVAAHRIVANSRAASNQLVNEGVDASRVRVIPNGIDLKRFPALARNGRVRRIVIVANLRSEKCHDVLLRAFARVAGMPELPRDLSLHVVGDGPLRQALEAQTRALGVEDRVSFLGHREDISALLASSDLFVLPSRSEAFPNSVMEAMASGMPVIASAVGGLLDLVEDGRNGLLVPPDDPEALGGAIARLVAQPTLAASLGASARRHVRERYSFDRMIASFEHLYLTELHARVPLAAERPAVTVP